MLTVQPGVFPPPANEVIPSPRGSSTEPRPPLVTSAGLTLPGPPRATPDTGEVPGPGPEVQRPRRGSTHAACHRGAGAVTPVGAEGKHWVTRSSEGLAFCFGNKQ